MSPNTKSNDGKQTAQAALQETLNKQIVIDNQQLLILRRMEASLSQTAKATQQPQAVIGKAFTEPSSFKPLGGSGSTDAISASLNRTVVSLSPLADSAKGLQDAFGEAINKIRQVTDQAPRVSSSASTVEIPKTATSGLGKAFIESPAFTPISPVKPVKPESDLGKAFTEPSNFKPITPTPTDTKAIIPVPDTVPFASALDSLREAITKTAASITSMVSVGSGGSKPPVIPVTMGSAEDPDDYIDADFEVKPPKQQVLSTSPQRALPAPPQLALPAPKVIPPFPTLTDDPDLIREPATGEEPVVERAPTGKFPQPKRPLRANKKFLGNLRNSIDKIGKADIYKDIAKPIGKPMDSTPPFPTLTPDEPAESAEAVKPTPSIVNPPQVTIPPPIIPFAQVAPEGAEAGPTLHYAEIERRRREKEAAERAAMFPDKSKEPIDEIPAFEFAKQQQTAYPQAIPVNQPSPTLNLANAVRGKQSRGSIWKAAQAAGGFAKQFARQSKSGIVRGAIGAGRSASQAIKIGRNVASRTVKAGKAVFNAPAKAITGAMDAGKGIASSIGASPVVAASQAMIESFQSVTRSMGSFVEALSPATMQVFQRTMRDLSAVIGVALLPGMQIATGIVRNFANALLPVTERLQPIVSQIGGSVAQIAGTFTNTFASVLTTLTPVVKIAADVFQGMAPIFQTGIAIFNGFVEVVSVAAKGLLSLFGVDVGDLTKNFKAAMEKLASSVLYASAAVLKFVNATAGNAFIDGVKKALVGDGVEKKNTAGLAAAVNPQISGIVEYSRQVLRSGLLAGPQGEKQADPLEWQKKTVEELQQLRKMSGESIREAAKEIGEQIASAVKQALQQKAKEVYSAAQQKSEEAIRTIGDYTGANWVGDRIGDAMEYLFSTAGQPIR